MTHLAVKVFLHLYSNYYAKCWALGNAKKKIIVKILESSKASEVISYNTVISGGAIPAGRQVRAWGGY